MSNLREELVENIMLQCELLESAAIDGNEDAMEKIREKIRTELHNLIDIVLWKTGC